MKNPFKGSVVPPKIASEITTYHKTRRGKGKTITVTRRCGARLPPSLLIYEHLAHVEAVAHYVSLVTLSPNHRASLVSARNLLTTLLHENP